MIQTQVRPGAALEASPFSSDKTRCDCGFVLSRHDFDTDDLGRTISLCPRCGPQLVPKRLGTPSVPRKPRRAEETRVCDCGESFVVQSRTPECSKCGKCRKALLRERLMGYNEKRVQARRLNAIAVGRKMA